MLKFKWVENLITMILTMVLVIVVSASIFFVHKFFFKTFEFTSKFTYKCVNVSTCKFDEISEVYNALTSQTSKNSTTIDIIDAIASKSNIRLSTSDVESSINIQLIDNVIVAKVTNKDSQAAIFIKDTLINQVFTEVAGTEAIQFTLIESTFTESPDILTYIYATPVLGATLGAILVASDFSFKKKQAQTAQKPVNPKVNNKNTGTTATI